MKFVYSSVVLLLLLTACGEKDFFSNTQTLANQCWEQKNKIKFEVDVTSTDLSYDFWVDFRHNDNYPYSDIYLFLDIEFPNGKSSHDTIHYIMQEPGGKWLGENSGSLVENHVMIKSNSKFPVKGKYKMSLQHAMRDDKLDGIEDVGLVITERK